MDPTLTSVDADGIFEPFQIGLVPWQESSRGRRFGMRFQHLSSFAGGSQISVSTEILEPGRQANQVHYHLVEEEHVLVLEGVMTLVLGERRFTMEAGHYVCFPAGQPLGHALRNDGDAPCRYLVFGNPQKHDVVVFPETGRVGVKLMGEGYDRAARRDYWQGVDDGAGS